MVSLGECMSPLEKRERGGRGVRERERERIMVHVHMFVCVCMCVTVYVCVMLVGVCSRDQQLSLI